MATSARLDELTKKFDENPRRYFAPLANEYRKLGDLSQAVALCRAHLPNQPGHISGHIVLAQALYEARELGESRQIFEASLDLDPENLIALRYLGDIAREQGEPGVARGWYERVLDADPRNDEIAQLLVQLDSAPASSATALESAASMAAHAADQMDVGAVDAAVADPMADDDASYVTTPSFELDADGADRVQESDLPTETVTSAWASAVPADGAQHFPVSGEPLHDLPSADGPMSFFEESSAPESYDHVTDGALADPFFGAAESAGTLASGELEAVGDSHVDDWFSSAAAPVDADSALSPERAPAAAFEDSFFPDLSHVTPAASHVVSSSPSRDEPTVASAALRASDLSTIPTPPFLAALDSDAPFAASARNDPSDSEASALPSQAAATGDHDAGFAPVSEADLVADEIMVTDRVAEEITAVDLPMIDAHARPAAEPAGNRWTEVTPAWSPPAVERPAAAEPFEPHDVEAAGDMVVAGTDSAWPIADETDDPTLEVELIPDAEHAPLVASAPEPALRSIDAFLGTDALDEQPVDDDTQEPSHFELQSARVEPEDEAVTSAILAEFDDEPMIAAAEASPIAEGDGFVVEYAEFVPPSDDDIPFIANLTSVPLTSDESLVSYDAYNVGAPEFSAHEPFSTELEAQVGAEEPPVVSASVPSEEVAVTPVEGLLAREVPAVEEVLLVEAAAGDEPADVAPAFVTETMAELYLQQGFRDEALAIYRQLLAQSPDDRTLIDRVNAIERGATSTVVEGIAPRDVIDRAGQSVRQFFAHLARRVPRARMEGEGEGSFGEASLSGGGDDGRSGEGEGRTAGAANRDEALTVPDDAPVAPSLTSLFASGTVSGADEDAATHLASAFGGGDFGGGESPPASRSAERELSLEHLFRDVPSHSSGAVTLDEYYQGSSPGETTPGALEGDGGEEHGADIEQFTAWLEGLKKK